MAGLILLHLLLLCLQLSIKLLAHCLHVHENRHEETSTGVPLLKEHAHAVPGARVHASTARHCAVLTSSFSMFCLTAGNTVPTVRSVKTPPIILHERKGDGQRQSVEEREIQERNDTRGRCERHGQYAVCTRCKPRTASFANAHALVASRRAPVRLRALASACERAWALLPPI